MLLLQINSSIHGELGQSSKLAQRFATQWLACNPRGRVVTRDLAQEPVPHLTARRFAAFSVEPESRTREQNEIVAYSDALIEELRAADVVAIGAPMYNFNISSTLRAYLDHIVRADVTFRQTATGTEGLIKGKKVFLFATCGAAYSHVEDTQIPHLKRILGFIGLTDVQFICAEGLLMGDEMRSNAIAKAHAAIEQLVAVARAA